jgi:hypothetical protein
MALAAAAVIERTVSAGVRRRSGQPPADARRWLQLSHAGCAGHLISGAEDMTHYLSVQLNGGTTASEPSNAPIC